jgi:hypothetical protein
MCWVCVIFSTKLYCVIHFTSHNQFPYGNIFPSTGKPYTACQCKVTRALCTAKLYGHSTDTALCIDTRTNTKYWKVQQLTYSGYQDLQHHLLIHDRHLKIISDPICTTTARTCQQDSHYCSASAVSSNYNNYPLSSFESNIHG